MIKINTHLNETTSPYKGVSGFRRLLNATFYSLKGFLAAWKYESAFRQEIVCATFMIPLAFYLTPDSISRILLIGSLLLVLIVELINSGIEAVVDRISLEKNELSGRAKDFGSAAVFVALTLALITWGLILL